MVKLGIFYELDDAGKDTGRVQVAEVGGDGIVYDTFDTEKEANVAMAKMQAEFDRNDKIEQEYSQWEKECMARHNIGQEELRVLLANGVMED